MITIQELLYNRGLEKSAKIKLVRHKDQRQDIYNLYRTDKEAFLNYQKSQAKDVFKNVEYIVSFVGEESDLSRFIGVYKIISSEKVAENRFEYEMIEISDFEDLILNTYKNHTW